MYTIVTSYLELALGTSIKKFEPDTFSIFHLKVGGGMAVALHATLRVSFSVVDTVLLHEASPSLPTH